MSGRSLLDVLQASMSVPRGIDGFWSIIRELDGLGRTWTISDIAARTNVHKRNVSDYVQGLTAAGYVILVNHAPAPRPKEGQINRAAIFMLLRLDIEDERWQRAMSAIRDAMRVVGSKIYVRCYERDRLDAEWHAVTIDLAKA